MSMIKVHNNIATREALPKALRGLKPESLADLSWTDPSLGFQDVAWWPEVDQTSPLGEYERYGEEILTIDADNKQVLVTREIVTFTAEEITQIELENVARQMASLTAVLQQHLDSTAQERNYDSILSLCSYATSSDPVFSAEGQAGVDFRDAVWNYGKSILATYESTGVAPSEEEVVAGLPTITWPV